MTNTYKSKYIKYIIKNLNFQCGGNNDRIFTDGDNSIKILHEDLIKFENMINKLTPKFGDEYKLYKKIGDYLFDKKKININTEELNTLVSLYNKYNDIKKQMTQKKSILDINNFNFNLLDNKFINFTIQKFDNNINLINSFEELINLLDLTNLDPYITNKNEIKFIKLCEIENYLKYNNKSYDVNLIINIFNTEKNATLQTYDKIKTNFNKIFSYYIIDLERCVFLMPV
jgi:hypothetical protein